MKRKRDDGLWLRAGCQVTVVAGVYRGSFEAQTYDYEIKVLALITKVHKPVPVRELRMFATAGGW